MTKKDYARIANAINKEATSIRLFADTQNKLIGMQSVANSIADALASDNPAFNRAKFLVAAGF